MYIPKAVVEFNKKALRSALSNFAQTENVSVAVFDNEANFVAGTKSVDVTDWTDRLKKRVKPIGLFQTDLLLPKEMAIAASPIMSEDALVGYVMIGNFYYSSTGKTYKPPEFDYPIFNAQQVRATVDLGKACVISSCSKIVPPDPQLCNHLADYILSNLDQPLNSRFLGEKFQISPRTIREVFEEKIGLSVLIFISVARILAAKRLLWQSDLPIKTVAERVGLTEEKLRKKFDTSSPEEYRQDQRNAIRNRIPIAFVTNDDYAPYLSTAIHSLQMNQDPEKNYVIFIFHSGLSYKSLETFRFMTKNRANVVFVNLEEQIRPYEDLFRTCAHYTKETYYRLFIPVFMGKFFDRFIYLDADLVINSDIGEILAESDPEKTVNAVLNYSTEEDAAYIESLGLHAESYINAGVMVIDCKRYIEADYFSKAIECLKLQETYRYVDQDVLNQICAGDIGLLSLSWNVQWNNLGDPAMLIGAVQEQLPTDQTPKIVHYTVEKPWNVMLNEYGDYYKKYAAENRFLDSFKV